MTGGSMHAITVHETGKRGEWNSLAFEEVPCPVAQEGEVLVQVEACSVNRADLLQRRGLYPPPPGVSSVPGLDFSGFVVGTAPNVDVWHLGDRVFGIVAGGGYGRYVAVPAEHLVAVPDNLSFVEAAAAAEVFFVAFLNLFLEAKLQPLETLLVHGGGSGVGSAAIQLAANAGVRTIITAGTSEKIQRCLELGAEYGINYQTEDFAAAVLEITQGAGVNVILDWIGAPYLDRHFEILKTRGRLVLIGLMGGATTQINLVPLLTKRLRVIGSVLRSRSKQEKSTLTQAFTDRVRPLFESGKVRPVVDRIFPIQEAEEAHRRVRDGEHFGKVVLTWQGERDSARGSDR